MGSQLRIAGLARSPDLEGALAHLDLDRGFALAARGSMSVTDVIDPTIWVREKLTVAMAGGPDAGEPQLKRLIAALRAIHAELMRRPERDRPWVSTIVVLLRGDDGVAVSAGDCPCFRFRDGLLSRLRRAPDEPSAGPPRGALGSEPQVRIEVVPLKPQTGDLYVLSTRALREGELAALARDLSSARDGAQLLRAGVEGSGDRGRLALRVLEVEEDATLAARADALAPAPGAGLEEAPAPDQALDPLKLSPLLPERETADGEGDGGSISEPETDASARADRVPPGVPGAVAGLAGAPSFEVVEEALEERAEEPPWIEPEDPAPREAVAIEHPEERDPERVAEAEPSAAANRVRRPAALAPVQEDRPWYEPLALWGGGALAIVALALLVRAILPGILGIRSDSGRAPAIAPATAGLVDFLSDPPGAAVRIDGVPIEGRTPLAGVPLDAGIHRVELDWGPSGVWRDTLEIAAGTRLVVHPAIFGSLTLRSSEASRVLDVFVDGTYAGTTPLTLNRVVVGRHLVRFGGPGMSTTAQEVEVLRDTPVVLVGSAGPLPENGRLTIRSVHLTDVGFEPSRNDPVWIDGVARGATPLSLDLPPGTHSVRVVRRNFPAQVSILDVKPGGEHFVTAEFGARSEEPIRFSPPASVSISNPLPVTVALPENEWDPSMALWLYAAAPGGSFQGKRMTRLEDAERTFAALLPPEATRNASRRVRFYFKATGTAGRELYSEIFTVPVRD